MKCVGKTLDKHFEPIDVYQCSKCGYRKTFGENEKVHECPDCTLTSEQEDLILARDDE
jgi:hypothetical protein